MNLAVITGASRGIGEALALDLIDRGYGLFCISRSPNKEIIESAKEKETFLQYINLDLSQIEETDKQFRQALDQVDWNRLKSISLINNAGTIDPICSVSKLPAKSVETAVNVNLSAPITTSSIFIEKTQDLPIPKKIINISSGAAIHAIEGWSVYCATKAGLNLFTKTAALEQKKKQHPVILYAFAPGVVDTAMQKEIREADKEDFPELDRFLDYKNNDALLECDYVAEKIVELITFTSHDNGEYFRIDS